jgi:transcription elongation factor Elf1
MEIRDFKNDVKAVVEYLAQTGIQVQHTLMLEAITRGFGERTWSAHRQALSALAQAGGQTAATSVTPVASQAVPQWRMEDGPMSDEQYIATKGARCPHCGSHRVSTDSVEADGSAGWANSECRDCDAKWSDAWELTGYFDLDVPERSEAADESDKDSQGATPGDVTMWVEGQFVSVWDGGYEIASEARFSLDTGVLDPIRPQDGEAVTTLDREIFRVANLPDLDIPVIRDEGSLTYRIQSGSLASIRRLLKISRVGPNSISLSEMYSTVQGEVIEVFEDGTRSQQRANCLIKDGALVDYGFRSTRPQETAGKVVKRYFALRTPAGRTLIECPLHIDPHAGADEFDPYAECYRIQGPADLSRIKELVLYGVVPVGAVELAAVQFRIRQLDILKLNYDRAVASGDKGRIEAASAQLVEKHNHVRDALNRVLQQALKTY